jgi:hypothetical protein
LDAASCGVFGGSRSGFTGPSGETHRRTRVRPGAYNVSNVKPVATSSPDPALQRLHEVAERIRGRSAARLQLRGGPVSRGIPAVLPTPVTPPPPRHWADDREPDADEKH